MNEKCTLFATMCLVELFAFFLAGAIINVLGWYILQEKVFYAQQYLPIYAIGCLAGNTILVVLLYVIEEKK